MESSKKIYLLAWHVTMRFVTQCHVRFVTHVTCGLWHMSHAVCDTCVHKSLFLESSKNLYLLGWHVTMSQSSRIMSQTACILSHVIDLILQVKNSWDVLHTSHAVCDTCHMQFVTHLSRVVCDTHVMPSLWHTFHASFVTHTSCAVFDTCQAWSVTLRLRSVTHVTCSLWHKSCAVCDTWHVQFVTRFMRGLWHVRFMFVPYLVIFYCTWEYLLVPGNIYCGILFLDPHPSNLWTIPPSRKCIESRS